MSAPALSDFVYTSGTLRQPRTLARLSWEVKLLLLYLAAITIFGKGPTYIGIQPFFWGEFVLACSLIWAIRRWHTVVFRSGQVRTLTLFVSAFMFLGAIEAARDYSVWGLTALRDSAIWYYGLFYFVGLVLASSSQNHRFSKLWKLFWLVAIPWGVANIATQFQIAALSPTLPRTGSPVLSSSGNETIQSVGLGCLLLLMDDEVAEKLNGFTRIIIAATGLAVALGSWGRGSRLGVIFALLVALGFSAAQRGTGRKFRRALLVVVALLATAAVGAVAAGFDLIESLQIDRFEGASLDNPDGTVEWRTVWWQALYEAVMEKNPTIGLGFGDNLAHYSPYIQEDDSELAVRSPHNYNVTVFARMGILGAIFWTGIVVMGILIPVWNLIFGSARRDRRQSQMVFWVAAITATWVNSSFGVLMEGPVLGIPFWLLLGLVAGGFNRLRLDSLAGTSTAGLWLIPSRLPGQIE